MRALPGHVVCSNVAVGEGGSRSCACAASQRPQRPKRQEFPRYNTNYHILLCILELFFLNFEMINKCYPKYVNMSHNKEHYKT